MTETIAVIQAGGLGTRMKEMTHDTIPKPMLKMNGKPMLLWQIEHLRCYNIKKIIIIIGHLGHIIKDYFKEGDDFGVDIDYIYENRPLGSAGSLFYLKDHPASRYLLIYGDVMFDMDIDRWLDFHKKKNSLITTVCHPNGHPYDSDLLVLNKEKQVCKILSKKDERVDCYKNLVNAGLYIFEKSVLEQINFPEKMDWEKEIQLLRRLNIC